MVNQRSKSFRISRKNFIKISNKKLSQKYILGDIIGEGGFGIVRKAKHKQTGLDRAIKTVIKSRLGEGKFREFHYLKELDHPHVIQIIEVIEEVRFIHLVTEFCTGGDLFEKINHQGYFSENQAAKYLKDILCAANYCHSMNIIHLDIKLENILLEDCSSGQNIKLIDFGQSQFLDKEKVPFKGSVSFKQAVYQAPETFGDNFDEKADIWSCGVILYVLLCGYPPFNGQTESVIQQRIINDQLLFPSPEWDKVSEDAQRFISQLLRKNPKERITIKKALKNKWLVSRADNIVQDKRIGKAALQNLAQFKVKYKQAVRNIRYAALSFIASQLLTKEDVNQLQQVFLDADKDKDGALNKEELRILMENTELGTPFDIDLIMQECDANQSGLIEYSEFLTACVNWRQSLTLEKLEAAFDCFDQDGDGIIDLQEIKNILWHSETQDEDFKNLIKEADKIGDQLISLEEFIHAALKLNASSL